MDLLEPGCRALLASGVLLFWSFISVLGCVVPSSTVHQHLARNLTTAGSGVAISVTLAGMSSTARAAQQLGRGFWVPSLECSLCVLPHVRGACSTSDSATGITY